jgi:hypothetical protein
MKKSLILLAVLFLTVSLLAQTDTAKTSKEEKWQGYIVRINQSESSLDVRGGQKNLDETPRHIQYDSATQWTKEGKPAEQSEFKEGSFVIVLGHAEKGVFHATRVDLRKPR